MYMYYNHMLGTKGGNEFCTAGGGLCPGYCHTRLQGMTKVHAALFIYLWQPTEYTATARGLNGMLDMYIRS